MSQINEELQKQHDKDVGAAFKTVFGNIPVIDKDQERRRLELEAILAKFGAVREVSDDY